MQTERAKVVITARTDHVDVYESNSQIAWLLWDQAVESLDKPIPATYNPIDWNVDEN